jgi:hypothetical protein
MRYEVEGEIIEGADYKGLAVALRDLQFGAKPKLSDWMAEISKRCYMWDRSVVSTDTVEGCVKDLIRCGVLKVVDDSLVAANLAKLEGVCLSEDILSVVRRTLLESRKQPVVGSLSGIVCLEYDGRHSVMRVIFTGEGVRVVRKLKDDGEVWEEETSLDQVVDVVKFFR